MSQLQTTYNRHRTARKHISDTDLVIRWPCFSTIKISIFKCSLTMISHAPPAVMFLAEQIRFSVFVDGNLMIIHAYLFWILTIDFRRVEILSFLYRYIGELATPFWRIKFVFKLAVFPEGHPVIIPIKIILNSDHCFQSRRVLFCYHDKPRPLAVTFLRFKFVLAIL